MFFATKLKTSRIGIIRLLELKSLCFRFITVGLYSEYNIEYNSAIFSTFNCSLRLANHGNRLAVITILYVPKRFCH